MATQPNTIIKSSKLSLRFCNSGKQLELNDFLTEYRRLTGFFVDEMWRMPKVPRLTPKELTDKADTWLSARMRQCAGKQASGIVRGCLQKQSQRLYIINKLNAEGRFKKARRLQRIYDEIAISKPALDNVEAQLDSRFLAVSWESATSFDGWLTIASIGNGMKLVLPLKKTKHFNKLTEKGKLRGGIRLSANTACFCFDLPVPTASIHGSTVGVDIGLVDVLSCSTGQVIGKDAHGHSYQTICQRLSRKKKGTKGFLRAVRHRTNFLHWAVNRLNLSGVSVLQRENIRDLRKFRRSTRTMQAWNYKELFDILDGVASDAGVQIRKLNPSYTSQRCSKCGWTWKGNRKGKAFKCARCGFTHDADLNASLNLSFNLLELPAKIHLQHPSRAGFYWVAVGQEPIVPAVQRVIP
jgi:putative transposase